MSQRRRGGWYPDARLRDLERDPVDAQHLGDAGRGIAPHCSGDEPEALVVDREPRRHLQIAKLSDLDDRARTKVDTGHTAASARLR